MAFGWFLLAVIYLSLLFWLGRWGDKHSPRAKRITSHPLIYSLALAIYCTAWTYFGAVGEAVRNQWNYLPIFLGPILLYLFGYRFLYKLVLVSKKQHITTIADFIASRYGKRQMVALLVTLIALLATIPYIALQLKAIGTAFAQVSGASDNQYLITFATLFIGLFCMYFGTQRTDVTEYRHGLMLAISFESILKLLALSLVAAISYFIWQGSLPTHSLSDVFSVTEDAAFYGVDFWLQTLIAAGAVVCLPRQFHVAIIDNLSPKHLTTARWLFPTYLVLIALAIPLIAAIGKSLFEQSGVAPDTYVLELALSSQLPALTALVFLGGLSAATAMIIVATLTLSTMVTNDVILPRMLTQQNQPSVYITKILWIRRAVIAGLLFFAYLYHQQLSTDTPLTSIGFLAFSLVVQLLPAIVGGLYWKQAHAHGVYAGLLAGMFSWVLWLFLPLVGEASYQELSSQMISRAAVVSFLINTTFYVVFSRLSTPRLIDKLQAQAFVDSQDVDANQPQPKATIQNEDLLTVLKTFLGDDRCIQLVKNFEQKWQLTIVSQEAPSQEFVAFCERALGGVIGASSANVLIRSVVSGSQINFEQLVQVFDETTQAIQINQSALFASLASLEQGISVIDKDLNLVAWNNKYLEMFDYPEGLVSLGTPIESLVRYNAKRGECGVGEIETLVQKRLEHLRNGRPHKFIRQRGDGKVIEMVGNPLPRGGFVTSFNDVSEHIELQQALKESNIDLEKRVQSRADEVKAINAELRIEIERRAEVEKQLVEARQIAEQANNSKTRFLALASHDVLQPLNAAKLYLSAIKDSLTDNDIRQIVDKLDDSVNASESMIATLLDIARLDQGDMSPDKDKIHLPTLLKPLLDEFAMKAKNKGLVLTHSIHNVWVNSDPTYLHRILRNLISNAVKYTEHGKVIVRARRSHQNIQFTVSDTGIGIGASDTSKVFDDFYRTQESNEQGVGLGLGVVSRLSEQLGFSVLLSSDAGNGSHFSFSLPRVAPPETSQQTVSSKRQSFHFNRVLCVDDDLQNLDAMKTLLTKWQLKVECAANCQQAITIANEFKPELILMDFQLNQQLNGLELINEIRKQVGTFIPASLVTAEKDSDLITQAAELDVHYLSKPIKPAKLRALLQGIKRK
ncbi:response regulator [Alteromonadaceae bacterium M269]|nr:response regulator [Alteromonadaceae bacterium M269]